MHGLHRQQQVDVVLDRVGCQSLRSLIPDNALQVGQQIASHPPVEAVPASLGAEDDVQENP